MDAWETLILNSTLQSGDVWEHLNNQSGGTGGLQIVETFEVELLDNDIEVDLYENEIVVSIIDDDIEVELINDDIEVEVEETC